MTLYQPKFWVRYVDDTFAIVKRQHVTTFMGILNSIYSDIKFTVEEERHNSLAFLDVSIHRQPDGYLHTKVFRKPTHTDRILHYQSNHPVSHKISCIKTLFKRVDSHCSTDEYKKEERRHLFRTCIYNGYPLKFIKRHCITFQHQTTQRRRDSPLQKTCISLPYISNISEATARLLAPHGIEVAHKPNQTLRSKIMRPKDPLPTMEKSAIVYKINCKNCEGNYVGETAKRLKTRLHEHKLAIKRGEPHSQLWMHMAQQGHQFDFNNTLIIASDATKGGRLLKEAWFSNNNSINRHIDLHPAQQALRKWNSNHHPLYHKPYNQHPQHSKPGATPPPYQKQSDIDYPETPQQYQEETTPPLIGENNNNDIGALKKFEDRTTKFSTTHNNNKGGYPIQRGEKKHVMTTRSLDKRESNMSGESAQIPTDFCSQKWGGFNLNIDLRGKMSMGDTMMEEDDSNIEKYHIQLMLVHASEDKYGNTQQRKDVKLQPMKPRLHGRIHNDIKLNPPTATRANTAGRGRNITLTIPPEVDGNVNKSARENDRRNLYSDSPSHLSAVQQGMLAQSRNHVQTSMEPV